MVLLETLIACALKEEFLFSKGIVFEVEHQLKEM